jgi:hypothetical protein
MPADCFDDFFELRMKSCFTARKHDVRRADRVSRFADNPTQKLQREKFSRPVIESVFVTQTVTAMQVADIGQLDNQTRRPVVARAPAVF